MRLSHAVAGFAILLGTSTATRAQLFNLEEEDFSTAAVTEPSRVPSSQILKVPAAQLPEATAEDTAKIDKLYGEIVKDLKGNQVDAATKLISNYDVITKQKIIYRLLKENPNDFRQPAATETTQPGLSPEALTPPETPTGENESE